MRHLALPGPVRTAIVTGASRGVGLETARGLVAAGHHVVLGVREIARGEAAAREIGGGEAMPLDVADLASVRTFARSLLARHGHLDLLVNNAGIHTARRERSPQGHELTFATNHLGHFLLTQLLLDALRAAPAGRVVTVASEAHRGAGGNDFARADEWSGLQAYTRSKLANIMFTFALARRLEGSRVVAHAVHPGSVRTGWARGPESGVLRLLAAAASPFLISPEKGARTSLHAATSKEAGERSGVYWVRCRPATPSRAARDVAAQEALWALSERRVASPREASGSEAQRM